MSCKSGSGRTWCGARWRYLWEVRLNRVRDAILASGGDAQVSEIATTWGFVHLGRFSQLYRRCFGQLPS
ncbi:Helix-turn-helix domain-containing protein [Pseudonocardia thermophila]|uniref:Helix-turn-helix domain-containing protein n=1 Tax=Pseudonocardia thermophila TaxID=1848 RepID=A0A1M6SZT2_PSETH|nr:helix-turn-helix domain-containing protein [Pseudonocardia thermophila]SHK50224.1 Helix-turn-helix domain-containing protein [Pseudonocardia thermophila]